MYSVGSERLGLRDVITVTVCFTNFPLKTQMNIMETFTLTSVQLIMLLESLLF